MAYGYAGRLLFVDLTAGTIAEESPDEVFYRRCIGGTGMGATILMERTKPGIDPLGPENMLGFTTGPLTATGVYGGGRFTVIDQVAPDRELGRLQLRRLLGTGAEERRIRRGLLRGRRRASRLPGCRRGARHG